MARKKYPKKRRRFGGETYTRAPYPEDVDYFGIVKSAVYSGRKYRIVGSKKHKAWFLYLGKKR